MIPKIVHFYWGSEILPFLRLLTIWSFIKFNPDWEVRFYYPKKRTTIMSWPTHEHKYAVSGQDYMETVTQFLPKVHPNVKIIELDFSLLMEYDEVSEVHRSDFLRWHILSTEGGLWSDMDIIYFRNIDIDLHNHTCFCVNNEYGHSVGFLLSAPKNKIFRRIKQKALAGYNPDNYQSMGSVVLNKLYPAGIRADFYNLPMDIVYAYNAHLIPEIFTEGPRGALRFTRRSVGLHWYAGHWLAGKYINLITKDNVNNFNNVLGSALRMAIGENYGDVSTG